MGLTSALLRDKEGRNFVIMRIKILSVVINEGTNTIDLSGVQITVGWSVGWRITQAVN